MDAEDERMSEQQRKRTRPPSSYGSMKTDSDSDVIEEEEEKEEGGEEEPAATWPALRPQFVPEEAAPEETRFHMHRSESPETLITMETEQPNLPGAVVIDTRMAGMEGVGEEEEEEEEEENGVLTNSPEPPEAVEPDEMAQIDDSSQSGLLHPEQALPHIFRSIQDVLSSLSAEELLKFKMCFSFRESEMNRLPVTDGDLLDFVDRMLEVLGPCRSLMQTIGSLEGVKKEAEAEELRSRCRRALIRFHMQQHLIRTYQVIREGVPRPGRQSLLDNIYVQPQISTCGHGGVDLSHELRAPPPSSLQLPSADTFVVMNELFRLQRDGGRPVRTVLTTGIPGIGLSVSVGKFCLDWALQRANKDLQFVITLSFRDLWLLRNRKAASRPMSIMEVLEYYHPECKDMKYLDEDDCRFLIVMDSFDCYQTPLDWKDTRVIKDSRSRDHPDALIVNIIRGTVLRGALVWILGRRAAVSQIPSEFIDVVTEIQGFSDQMRDSFLTKRFSDPDFAARIVAHHKRLPTLATLARQPFVCWMVATELERCFRMPDYGLHPPRLTPFYISILIVQTNRMLEFYGSAGNIQAPQTWSRDVQQHLMKIGKLAFRMLERNRSVFYEADVKECGLKMPDVAIFSGLCTELPAAAAANRGRSFCFVHLTYQEFMAALHVFTAFRSDSKNILGPGSSQISKVFTSRPQSRSVADVLQCALERTLGAPPGHYDMFLRFLCGLLSPDCHDNQLSGFLYSRQAPKLGGLKEARRQLERVIETAQTRNREHLDNLKECLREMIQEDP